MYRIARLTVIIFLLGLVLLAPAFELFDGGQDLDHGTDIVLLLLCVFMSMGLFTICKRIVSLLFRLLLIATVSAGRFIFFPNPSIQVEISPPENVVLLGSLRI